MERADKERGEKEEGGKGHACLQDTMHDYMHACLQDRKETPVLILY